MSKFSEKCKALLLENGTNVYRLANDSSLERTALQRMVTGRRLPGIDFVRQFCRELRMPLAEEQYLMELYKMESIGEDVYRNRQYIHNLIRYLSRLEKGGFRNLPDSSANEISFEKKYSGGISDFEFTVYSVLEKCFESEEKINIYTNYPATDGYFFKQLQMLNRRYAKNKVSIHHLIHFQINTALTAQNLQILYNVLPLTLSNTLNYTSYYYYSRVSDEELCQFFFPYYIITPKCLLEISGDLQYAVLHSDLQKIKAYMQEHDRLRCFVKPLFQSSSTPEEAWIQYKNLMPTNVKKLQVIGAQPCYWDLINDRQFERMVNEYCPEFSHFVKSVINSHCFYEEREMNLFFTEEGLDYFCSTGKMTGQIGAVLPALSRKERTDALEKFLHHNPLHHYYLLSSKISIPLHLNFEVYENKQFQMIQITDELKVSIFTVTESSICDAFWDYTESLKDMENLLSEEETEQVVRGKLMRLKRGDK